MSEFQLLTLITAIVVIGGVIWLVRSVRRPISVDLDPDEMVILVEARDELEAKVLASKVNAFGIRTFVRNRHGPILYGFPPTFVGWNVLVRHGDMEEARRLIDLDPLPDAETDEPGAVVPDAERY